MSSSVEPSSIGSFIVLSPKAHHHPGPARAAVLPYGPLSSTPETRFGESPEVDPAVNPSPSIDAFEQPPAVDSPFCRGPGSALTCDQHCGAGLPSSRSVSTRSGGSSGRGGGSRPAPRPRRLCCPVRLQAGDQFALPRTRRIAAKRERPIRLSGSLTGVPEDPAGRRGEVRLFELEQRVVDGDAQIGPPVERQAARTAPFPRPTSADSAAPRVTSCAEGRGGYEFAMARRRLHGVGARAGAGGDALADRVGAPGDAGPLWSPGAPVGEVLGSQLCPRRRGSPHSRGTPS